MLGINKETGRTVVYLFQCRNHNRPNCLMTAVPIDEKQDKDLNVQGMADIIKFEPPKTHEMFRFDERLLENLEKNVPSNYPLAKMCNYTYHPKDIAVIVGNGKVHDGDMELLEEFRRQNKHNVYVLTAGAAQTRYIEGDFYVGQESYPAHMGNLDPGKVKNTIAHLDISTWPEVARLPWKKVTWFALRFAEDLRIPRYWSGTSVVSSSLQFAAKVLKSKKIIMMGVEHPLIMTADGKLNITYYEAAQWIKAKCWWMASQHGIEIWNCTPNTTVTTGVILGSFKEALREIAKENK